MRKFIAAHQKKFMQKGDVHPLKPIQNGGGGCSPLAPKTESLPEPCGGDTRGKCDSSRNPPSCYCVANWTGPHCLNPVGYDDIQASNLPNLLMNKRYFGKTVRAVILF